MAFVYIIESVRDGRYYVGSTSDINARLSHHFSGYTPTTKRFGEIKLVFSQKFSSLRLARKVEYKLKRMKRKDYLRKIIADGVIRKIPA